MFTHAAPPLVMQKAVEQPPIGQSGQGIMLGEAGNFQLQQLALGDIDMGDGKILGIKPGYRRYSHHKPALGVGAVAGVFQIELILLMTDNPEDPLHGSQSRGLGFIVTSPHVIDSEPVISLGHAILFTKQLPGEIGVMDHAIPVYHRYLVFQRIQQRSQIMSPLGEVTSRPLYIIHHDGHPVAKVAYRHLLTIKSADRVKHPIST